MAPRSFLCAEAQELINGLLQHPDARAGLQISVSMCLLFDGWCFNILDLNRGRSAWWGPSHGYSGAQPGAPERWGDWEREREGMGTENLLLSLTPTLFYCKFGSFPLKKERKKENQSSTSHTCHNERSQCWQSERWTMQGLEQSLIKGPGARRWQLTSLTPSSPIPHQGGT